MKAVVVSDTVRVSGTDWPEVIFRGDVVLKEELVEAIPPSSTVTPPTL